VRIVSRALSEPARVFEFEPPRSAQKRAALVMILGDHAEPILDGVVADTLRATDFVGLGQMAARRYADTARTSLPIWLNALGADDDERSRILDANVTLIKHLVVQGIPKFVQRSLVSLGFRAAHGIARSGAHAQGFEPNELEEELRVFQRTFEARLFFGV
jgi:hypothetical protein